MSDACAYVVLVRAFTPTPHVCTSVSPGVPPRGPVFGPVSPAGVQPSRCCRLSAPRPGRLQTWAAHGTSPTEWPPGRAPRKVCAGVGDSKHRPAWWALGARTAQRLQAVRFRPSPAGVPGGPGVEALSQHIGPSRPPSWEINTREAPGGCWMVAPWRALPVTGVSRVRPTQLGARGPCGGADRPTVPS